MLEGNINHELRNYLIKEKNQNKFMRSIKEDVEF